MKAIRAVQHRGKVKIIPDGSYRKDYPQFTVENVKKNLQLMEKIEERVGLFITVKGEVDRSASEGGERGSRCRRTAKTSRAW
jgi:hypothetical protein